MGLSDGGVIVAVDGGGSKTDAVALSADGEVLATARGAGSSPHLVGLGTSVQRIDELVRSVAGDRPVVQADVYLAGLDLPVEIERFRAAVAPLPWTGAGLVVDNDLYALLRAGSAASDAVVVICGTGMNALAVRADGAVARYPALGTISGDWGGGGDLALTGLWHAARAEDGRGPATALATELPRALGVRDVLAIVHGLHLREIPIAALTAQAPLVLELAEAGDPVATALVERQIGEIVGMGAAAARRLGLSGAGLAIVLGGGIIRSGDRRLLDGVRAGFARELPGSVPEVVSAPPILGAGLAALGSAGASAEVLARARASLERMPEPQPLTSSSST